MSRGWRLLLARHCQRRQSLRQARCSSEGCWGRASCAALLGVAVVDGRKTIKKAPGHTRSWGPGAEGRGRVSAAGHAKGEGDEVELFIPWGATEAGQGDFSIVHGTEHLTMFVASVWVVISSLTQLLKLRK